MDSPTTPTKRMTEPIVGSPPKFSKGQMELAFGDGAPRKALPEGQKRDTDSLGSIRMPSSMKI
eukprot:CAMPEP_0172599316 /NCGR_PEP_ID=MMETSP1068-20121228/19382_1 /TAXON_ID=35684 /ORGANISM="Pseudopedinella elastica, Strain CCMP716" /LENGTH=62 /DNA_ID=CAMNT_0013399529 /DNA_START=256 /DNA_END=444 /DNA_ORIENTATION=+